MNKIEPVVFERNKILKIHHLTKMGFFLAFLNNASSGMNVKHDILKMGSFNQALDGRNTPSSYRGIVNYLATD